MSNQNNEEEVEVEKPSALFPETVRSLCELSALAVAKSSEKFAGSTFILYEAPAELRVHIASAVRAHLTQLSISGSADEASTKTLTSWLSTLELTYDYSIDLSSKNTKRSILNTLQTFNQYQTIKFIEDEDEDDNDIQEISLKTSTQSLGNDIEKQQDELIKYYESLDNPNDNANELRRSKGIARATDNAQILCKVLSQCPNIYSAVFFNCSGVTNDAIKLLCKLKHLVYLDLSECWNFDEGLLNGLNNVPLKYLSLAGCDISDKVLKTLRIPTLLQLDLSKCSKLTDYGKLSEMPQLQTLSLADCKHLNNKSIEYLALCKNLVSLDLSGCIGLSDKGIISFGKLASTSLPHLRELSLNLCGHLSTTAVCLMLRELQQLTTINLQECNIRDMKKLKSSNFKFNHILSLDLSSATATTSYDFRRFIGQFPNLQSLSLQGIRSYELSEFKNFDTIAFNMTQLVYLDVLQYNVSGTPLSTAQAPKFPALTEVTGLSFHWLPTTAKLKKIYIADDDDTFYTFDQSSEHMKKMPTVEELVIGYATLDYPDGGWLKNLLTAVPNLKKITFHDCYWRKSSPESICTFLDTLYELEPNLTCIHISVPSWEHEAEMKARLAKVAKVQIVVESISKKEVERLYKGRITQIDLHKHGIF